MLKESKTTKYLMYAFGEIILVVVGILIALQINNWKEHKKLEILEIKMLSEVKNGLKFDLQEIEGAIKFHNSIIKSQEIAANWLQNKLSFQDSLAQHFMRATFSSNFVFKDAPYETLKKIGLEIIKNETLKDEISNLYDLKYEEIFFENRDLFNYKEHFRIMMSEDRFEFLDKNNLYKGFKPLDALKLKSDKTYSFKLNLLKGSFYLYNINLKNLKKDINELITKIDAELKIRNH